MKQFGFLLSMTKVVINTVEVGHLQEVLHAAMKKKCLSH